MLSLNEAASYALDALTKAGAKQGEVTLSRTQKDELTADAGRFTLFRTTRSAAVGMKALIDGRKGVSALNSLEKDAIDACARECVESALGAQPDPAEELAPLTENDSFVRGVLECDRPALYDRAEEFLGDVAREFPAICLEQVCASFVYSNEIFLNTNGVRYEDENGGYDFNAMFSAKDGENASSFNYFGVVADNLDSPFIALADHRTQLRQSAASLHTVPFGKKLLGQIVLMPDCFDELLNEALNSFCGSSAIIDSTSPWKDKLGTAVAAPFLTVSSDPFDGRLSVCGERFHGGEKSRAEDIISGGVLKNFLLSRYASNKTGFKRFPNGGGHIVVSGAPDGVLPLEKLLSGIDRGLLVGRFSGGQPTGSGDFSGVAKNSFLIEGGRITNAVSETMISGNLQDLMKDMCAISAESRCDGNSVLPYALCDGVTIS
ncbi:MAG: TldD/PmbA family protein [Clostridium sp.]|nr:TldD/PmbA family protein [Clostridium sp.]